MERAAWVTAVVAAVGVSVLLATVVLGPPATTDVTFHESGLPIGGAWTITIGGTAFSASADNITVQLTRGSFNFSAAAQNATGYRPYPASGSVNVSATALHVAIVFVRTTANVSVEETGLPQGMVWVVAEGTTYHASNTSVLLINEPDGPHTLRILVGSLPSITNVGPVWIQDDLYLPNVSRLQVSVNGSDLSVPVSYRLAVHMNWTLFPVNVFPNDTAVGAPAYEHISLTFYAYTAVNFSFSGTILNGVPQNATGYVMSSSQFAAFTRTGNATSYLVATGNVSEATIPLTFDSGTWVFMVTGWSVDEFHAEGMGWIVTFPGTLAYFS